MIPPAATRRRRRGRSTPQVGAGRRPDRACVVLSMTGVSDAVRSATCPARARSRRPYGILRLNKNEEVPGRSAIPKVRAARARIASAARACAT